MKRLLTGVFALCIAVFFSAPLFGSEPLEDFPRLTNEKFTETIKNKKKYVLVDVRTPEEFKAGHIPGAININVKDSVEFASKTAKLDKKKTIALYCRGGVRSKVAAQKLLADNYKVVDLVKGFDAWDGATTKEAD